MRRRYRDLPIHAKLLVPFAILMLVWGAFGTAILVHGTSSESRARVTAQLATAFDGARSILSDDERGLLETVRLASNTQGIAAATTKRDVKVLGQLLEPIAVNAGHDWLRVFAKDGTLLFSFDTATRKVISGKSHTSDTVVRTLAGKADARGDKFASIEGTDLVVAGPVKDSAGRVVAAVAISEDLAHLSGRIGRGIGMRVAIFSVEGEPIAGNGGPLPYRAASNTGVHVSIKSDEAMEAFYGPLAVRGERAAVMAVALPAKVVLAGVQGKTAWLAILVAVAVFAALAIGLYTARAITAPISALVQATGSLRDGDLHVRAPESSRDEIGTLAASFNAMAAQMEASHHGLERQVEERTSQLWKANAQLSRVSSAKSAFLATLSHELRTPLNGIIGFADMLSDPTFGEHSVADTRELASNILVGGRHLLGLIDDLLDLAKIEAGKIDIKLQPTTIGSVTSDVESALRSLGDAKHLQMTTAVDDRLPLVMADPSRLRQILFNLVANAIKFTPDGGLITVDAVRDEDAITVSVADTGPGLTTAEVARIFEPYERGEAGREVDGAGLGLALARLLTDLQGGRLWVESVPGRGSTFFLTIPVADSQLVDAGVDGNP